MLSYLTKGDCVSISARPNNSMSFHEVSCKSVTTVLHSARTRKQDMTSPLFETHALHKCPTNAPPMPHKCTTLRMKQGPEYALRNGCLRAFLASMWDARRMPWHSTLTSLSCAPRLASWGQRQARRHPVVSCLARR
jgi:hypothetical protein